MKAIQHASFCKRVAQPAVQNVLHSSGPFDQCARGRSPVHPAAGGIHNRLAISKPGDKCEQEAEQVAERVMRMESTGEAPNISARPQSRMGLLPSAGRPLDAGSREFMEPRFGADLSNVRLHTDLAAASTARDL